MHLLSKLNFLKARVVAAGNKAEAIRKKRSADSELVSVNLLKSGPKLNQLCKGCKYMFHLAGVFSPCSTGLGDENFVMTKNILDASMRHGISKVLIASSAAVYSTGPSIIPTPESLGREGIPNGLYGESKRACEDLAMQYVQKYRICLVIARMFNVYGPGDYSQRFIPSVMEKALENQSIYVKSHGNQARDFIYVEDCVEGLVKCMERGQAGQIFNICTGRKLNLVEAAKIIVRKLHSKSQVKLRPQKEEKDVVSVGDTSFAEKWLGFRARIKFEEGIGHTIKRLQAQNGTDTCRERMNCL